MSGGVNNSKEGESLYFGKGFGKNMGRNRCGPCCPGIKYESKYKIKQLFPLLHHYSRMILEELLVVVLLLDVQDLQSFSTVLSSNAGEKPLTIVVFWGCACPATQMRASRKATGRRR